ncbi:MAG: hypothetical protein J07HQX50_01495 [Haloquadratum sp. J07HQX50]|nr:MAG: hypothetical protein J07HQX50_01495 [Haloquadratum sp. J07HQX50]
MDRHLCAYLEEHYHNYRKTLFYNAKPLLHERYRLVLAPVNDYYTQSNHHLIERPPTIAWVSSLCDLPEAHRADH